MNDYVDSFNYEASAIEMVNDVHTLCTVGLIRIHGSMNAVSCVQLFLRFLKTYNRNTKNHKKPGFSLCFYPRTSNMSYMPVLIPKNPGFDFRCPSVLGYKFKLFFKHQILYSVVFQIEGNVDKTTRTLTEWRTVEAKNKKLSHTAARENEKLQDLGLDGR